MKGESVEIIKIGSVMGWRKSATLNDGNKICMIISDGDAIIDFYVSIYLNNYNKEEYSILRTTADIVGKAFINGLNRTIPVSGIVDDNPEIGKSFTINNSSWHTSMVNEIFENCIIVTRNSIYAIHNESNMREMKLNKILKNN